MTRSLVLCPNWVGDTVMALPVLDALAASRRQLTVMARPHLRPLLELVPAVDAVLETSSENRANVDRIARGGFDEAIVLPNSFRSAWLAFRGGVPRRWGYGGSLRSLLLAPAVPRRGTRAGHQTLDYRRLLERLGVSSPASWTPRLRLDEASRRAGLERLRGSAPSDGARRWIGLFPGAEFGPSKRWPPERFAELAAILSANADGGNLVLLAGPREEGLARKIRALATRPLPILGPNLDLAELAAVLAGLDLLVSNDSGPMHLAAAVGAPCVALFGPTDPERTRPAGDGHLVLYTDRWCSPCFRRRCPLRHHRCLREISAPEVAAACRRALGSGS